MPVADEEILFTLSYSIYASKYNHTKTIVSSRPGKYWNLFFSSACWRNLVLTWQSAFVVKTKRSN